MRSRSYSRVSRSWMISRWRRPRKPQRKPKPSAALVSISKLKLASLRRSLERQSRSFSKSAASTGNRPQKTTGWTTLKPGSAAAAGRLASVMVSPTLVSATSLICAVMKPISPGPSSANCSILGRKQPTRSTRWVVPAAMKLTCWPLRMRAVDHADEDDDAEIGVVPAVDQHRLQRRVASPLGGGMRATIASSTSSMPMPVLAEVRTASYGGEADDLLDLLPHALEVGGGQVDLVDHRHDLMVVLDRLVDVGERLRLDPLRRVDHQQRALAGGEAAADLIGEVDVARRVHQVEDVALPFEPHRLRLDGDPALALDVHIVEHLALPLISRSVRPPVAWISRSASVDLPWSIWAMIEKLRMRSMFGHLRGALAGD